MTSQPVSQTTAICLLTDISRTKGNQITNFGHLIKYNMKFIFLEKSYRKCGGEIIVRLFSKK